MYMCMMSIFAANSHLITMVYQNQKSERIISGGGWRLFLQGKPCNYYGCDSDQRRLGLEKMCTKSRRVLRAASFWEDMSAGEVVEMEEINDCEHLDLILLQAKDLSQPILIDWMAAWCRKCIYLKPKLEKLAAEYGTRLKFYCVDVNHVPQTLVKRGNISKMPTIQLWKDGEWKAEVIGGHKAWLVVDEVREMIQKFG